MCIRDRLRRTVHGHEIELIFGTTEVEHQVEHAFLYFFGAAVFFIYLIPVSYTHLDVYKRQATLMAEAINNNGKIISCGNGGSHCDAMHFAEELTGRYRDNRRALPAIAISDPSHLSCVSNDFGFEYVFSRFVEGLGLSLIHI